RRRALRRRGDENGERAEGRARRQGLQGVGQAGGQPQCRRRDPRICVSMAEAAKRTVSVKIEGRVQGVYFRAWTDATARGFGLSGTVRNANDGSVEAVFSGPAEKVEEMLKLC